MNSVWTSYLDSLYPDVSFSAPPFMTVANLGWKKSKHIVNAVEMNAKTCKQLLNATTYSAPNVTQMGRRPKLTVELKHQRLHDL